VVFGFGFGNGKNNWNGSGQGEGGGNLHNRGGTVEGDCRVAKTKGNSHVWKGGEKPLGGGQTETILILSLDP